MTSHILTLVCPDRPGIVASIAEGLLRLEANIVENAQFSDVPTGMFCMRTRFESPIDDARDVAEALRGRAEAWAAICGSAGRTNGAGRWLWSRGTTIAWSTFCTAGAPASC